MTDDTDTWNMDVRARLSVLSANLETLAAHATALADESDHPHSREFDVLAESLREEELVIQDALQSGTTAEQEETFRVVLDNVIRLRKSTSSRILSELDERADGTLETFE